MAYMILSACPLENKFELLLASQALGHHSGLQLVEEMHPVVLRLRETV